MKHVLLPLERLATVRDDLARFARGEALNGYQQWIISSLFQYEAPALDFTPRSILLVAVPCWARRDITFTIGGKVHTFPTVSEGMREEDTPAGVAARFAARGTRVRFAPNLPCKRLAACSGLAAYGRNNISYVEGMGSFHALLPFFTDQPCERDPWREMANLPHCAGCDRCVQACPTGAIRPDRFLIDNERCLTAVNQNGEPKEFPDWIPPSAHHCVVECLRCQCACPQNTPYLQNVGPAVTFDETETALLLRGTPLQEMPEGMQAKVADLEWKGYLPALPRNIRALIPCS